MSFHVPECEEVRYAKEKLRVFQEFFKKKHVLWAAVERMKKKGNDTKES